MKCIKVFVGKLEDFKKWLELQRAIERSKMSMFMLGYKR